MVLVGYTERLGNKKIKDRYDFLETRQLVCENEVEKKRKEDGKDRIRGARRRIMYEQMNGIEKGKGKGEKGWVGQAGEEGWKRERNVEKIK